MKTICTAVAKAFPGDTVWVHSGTYRERIVFPRDGEGPGKPISLRAHPGDNVAIKGSVVVAGWTRHSGNVWKRDAWTVNSQQLFVDGVPLRQIGANCPFHRVLFGGKPILPPEGKGLRDVRPGTFYYDPSTKVLFAWLQDGSDPNRHTMEASVLDFLIPPVARSFIVLEGLDFSHSNATSMGAPLAMANVWGKSWAIKRCSFHHADFAGMALTGEGHRIERCAFNRNGNVGISVNGSDEKHRWGPVPGRTPQNIVLDGNETSFNNYRGFDPGWQAGGVKAAVSCSRISMNGHKAIGNNGAGIWIDAYCDKVTVARSVVSNNLVGIAHEISDNGSISNNIVSGNRYHGIYVAASDNVVVRNNNLVENGFGIVLHGMPRAEHPSLRNNEVRNNLFLGSTMIDLVIYRHPGSASGNVSDGNLFATRDKRVKIAWTDDEKYHANYTDLSSFSADAGQDRHSLVTDPSSVGPRVKDFNRGGKKELSVFGAR